MVWCQKKTLWRWKAKRENRTTRSPLFGFDTEILVCIRYWWDSPIKCPPKLLGATELVQFFVVVYIYIYIKYIQLQLESNCCRIWEYHNLWKQSFGLCCREIVCEFAGHSFPSLRKQGVHVWVPVWRSGPFWYYSFWPVQSETKMRTWSLFIMRYTAIPRVIMSFCVSDNAFSSCIFFVGVRVPFRLEF